MTDRELLKMALDALNMQTPLDQREFELRNAAIEALRQALSQPEQRGHCTCGDPTILGYVHFRTRPCIYYTAPPKREWVGLTDVEIMGMTCECVDDGTFNMDCARDFANRIEAKLKEKNT